MDILRALAQQIHFQLQHGARHQAPDHPIHPAIAETAYLKTFICRAMPDEKH
ncbi:MAG: hypothetical protein R3E08_14940 [Thiotrichaceae bacterium]